MKVVNHGVVHLQEGKNSSIHLEISYYVKTHISEKLSRPDLFRLNAISHAEKLESLLLLDNYNDHTENQTAIANLTSNIDVMKALSVNLETVPDKGSNSSTVNKLCVVIQLTYKKYESFIGYF